MTLNAVITLILRFPPNSTQFQADYITVVEEKIKNRKLHCRPILKTFNDNEQLHNKIICSVNLHILASN